MMTLHYPSGLYILTVSLYADEEGGRKTGAREIQCEKDSATIAGFEDEGGGHKPRNVSSF